jgi:hypothetical protein
MVSDVSLHAPIGKSHHSVITFKFQCYTKLPVTKLQIVYDKGNYDKFREMHDSVKWSHILSNKNGNDCWDIFKQIMDEGIKN